MRRRGMALGLAVGLLAGCRLFGGSGSSEPSAPEPPGLAPSALVGRVGEVLELSVPLLGGGVQPLEQLRGQPVLLDLFDASSAERDEAQRRYRDLVQRNDGAFTVVSVSLDPQTEAIPASWIDDPPPFVLGWDPQGALAARLQLVVLPTVVLLDATGVIVAVHEGVPPDEAALERWLHPG